MGNHLSEPVREKGIEEGYVLKGSSTPVSWAVVDMQGWRKRMEDAHIAQTNVPLKKNDSSMKEEAAQVFAVFDGHLGAEVARFCALHLVDVLKSQPEWSSGKDIGRALSKSFHSLDRMIDDTSRMAEILSLQVPKQERHSMRRKSDTSPIPSTKPENNSIIRKSETSSIPSMEPDHDAMRRRRVSDTYPIPCLNIAQEEEFRSKRSLSDTLPIPSMKPDHGFIRREESVTYPIPCLNINSDTHPDKNFSNDMESIMKTVDDLEDIENLDDSERKTPSSNGCSNNTILDPGSLDSHHDKDDKDSCWSEYQASKIVNGKQVCNLPNDFFTPAGCTALCVVILNRTLVVANAGDSRAVLCRGGGKTHPLSLDHKPTQERELIRIFSAGGFVNNLGRVNGNLNLSRAIGDLKYKQKPGIPPSEQMITAEPDIHTIDLKVDDEFIILACDGVWDCLTNEAAVQYVSDRIDKQSLKEIGIEMLDSILSPNPRKNKGRGSDNMTVILIDLQPKKRQRKQKALDNGSKKKHPYVNKTHKLVRRIGSNLICHKETDKTRRYTWHPN